MNPTPKTFQVFLPEGTPIGIQIAESAQTKKQVLQKVVDFVDTFIKGMAA